MNAKEKETSSPYSGLVGTGGERIVRCNHCMKTFEEHEIPDNDGIDVCPYCGKTDGLMDIGMAQMNAKQFIAKLSEEKGVDVTVAAVRHHARLGRIGYRNDGRWVFETKDLERMMEYAGKQGPRKKQLRIKPLEWIEEDTFVAFGCFGTFEVMESVDEQGSWTGSLNDNNGYDGYEEQDFPTAEEAKVYCEKLHEKQIRAALKFVSWEVM